MKFNPVSSMRSFFTEVLKYEPSLVVVNHTMTEQIQLAKSQIPTNKDDFKKYFAINVDTCTGPKKQHLIVGCTLLGDRTFCDIKFDKTKPQLMEWMKKEEIFVETDSLGIHKTVTIGYLTQLHPTLTNRATLKNLLSLTLEDIVIDANLAAKLDPSLKPLQQQAKSNGDVFVLTIPPFEVYKTRITHRCNKLKVLTDIIGIKCAQSKAKLLKEFYMQLGSPAHYEKQIGIFVPTEAAHSLGSDHYAKLLSDNNAFLQSVVTIPVGDCTHETLDIPFSEDVDTDINQTTLIDVIMDQKWCLNVEKTSINNKILILTTKNNLEQARQWIDATLPNLYENHIANKLDVMTIKQAIPRRLDKPIMTAASTAYADKLKQCMSGTRESMDTSKLHAKLPHTNKFQPVGVSFDEKEFPVLNSTTKATNTKQQSNSANGTNTQTTAPVLPPSPKFDYKAELKCLSNEIENNLKKQFEACSKPWIRK